MKVLSLKNIIDRIIDSNIFYTIYEYSEDNFCNLKNKNILNISKEVIFIVLLKLMTPRDFNKLKSVDIDINNEASELKHSLVDSDSLFNVYLYSTCNQFFIHNGKKIYNGDCVLSKNEIIQANLYSGIKFKIKNKRYYSININKNDYINLMDNIFNIIEYKFDNIITELDREILNFTKSVKIEGRLFVVDLILRDYYNLLKLEINRLENDGYSIKEVKNTNISFV